jgi:chromosome segregation ATPase
MANDINKYKKIEKDLNTLQINYNELEKGLNLKLNNIIHQRDNLQRSCDELKDKTQEYEQLKIKYDQLYSGSNIDQLQQELNEAKTKNDLLRQRNWKIMEQLNKLLHEQKQNQSP